MLFSSMAAKQHLRFSIFAFLIVLLFVDRVAFANDDQVTESLIQQLNQQQYEFGWFGGGANKYQEESSSVFRVTSAKLIEGALVIEYEWKQGTLIGKMNGRKYSGRWRQNNGHGFFELKFDPDLDRADGWWIDAGRSKKHTAFLRRHRAAE